MEASSSFYTHTNYIIRNSNVATNEIFGLLDRHPTLSTHNQKALLNYENSNYMDTLFDL